MRGPPRRRRRGQRQTMPSSRSRLDRGKGGGSGTTLASPMQGTIVKVAVADGTQVAEGDLVVVLEAMKMEQPVQAPRDGVVTGLNAPVGQTISSGHVLLELA